MHASISARQAVDTLTFGLSLSETFALAPARSPSTAFSSQSNDTICSGCLSPPFPTLTDPLNLN